MIGVQPDVSVVVPTHNRVALLRRALASVLAQEGVALEVIVVDDASSDATQAELAGIGDARVRVLRHETNLGLSRSRNDGIAIARGDWVAFLDDDDLWAPTKLRRQLESVAGDGDAVLSWTGVVVFDERGRVERFDHASPADALERRLCADNALGGPSGVMARTSALRQAGGFDEALTALQDWDLWLRLAPLGTGVPMADILTGYFLHGANLHSSQLARVEADLDLMRERYTPTALRHGTVFFGPPGRRWLAGAYVRNGRRLCGLRLYAWLALRHRDGVALRDTISLIGGARLCGLLSSARRRLAGPGPVTADPMPAWLADLLVSDETGAGRTATAASPAASSMSPGGSPPAPRVELPARRAS